MSEDKYTQWRDIVSKTAYFVAKDFPDVEVEDLFQDLMTYVLGNNHLKSPDAEHVPSGLYKRAVKFAWEYRKQSLYITSQYSYRTSDVRKILETVFNHNQWATSFLPDDAKSLSDDDRLVVNSDIKRAYDALSETYQVALFTRYALKVIPDNSKEKSRLNRAVEKLTDFINFFQFAQRHEGPGKRRVITNATANYIIQEQDGRGGH